jgi:peptide deformylase
MKLPLRYYGDPILRQKAEPIEKITDEIKQLAHDMIETMIASNGIGLAANQVGHLVRMFVSILEKEDEKGNLHYGPPRVYINPILSNPSSTLVEMSEGCLSLPKLYIAVARPLTIHIEALDLEGNPFFEDCHGYVARNRMHENDHLNGSFL